MPEYKVFQAEVFHRDRTQHIAYILDLFSDFCETLNDFFLSFFKRVTFVVFVDLVRIRSIFLNIWELSNLLQYVVAKQMERCG
jgi:hypothetical protein